MHWCSLVAITITCKIITGNICKFQMWDKLGSDSFFVINGATVTHLNFPRDRMLHCE
jgi:hypothetical protein